MPTVIYISFIRVHSAQILTHIGAQMYGLLFLNLHIA